MIPNLHIPLIAPWSLLAIAASCTPFPISNARALEAEGHWEAAGKIYLSAARADPAHLAAWDGAVRTLCQKSGRVGACMNVLDLELELLGRLDRHRDALAEVLEKRARTRLNKGLAKSALTDLLRAQNAAPNRASTYAAKAKAHIMLGQSKQARSALKQARTLDPKNNEANRLFRELPGGTQARADSETSFGGPSPH